MAIEGNGSALLLIVSGVGKGGILGSILFRI